MRAIVHDPVSGLRMSDVPDPEPAPHELLLDLVARGALDPQVSRREPWLRFAEVAGDLRDRRIAGKAVLEVGG